MGKFILDIPNGLHDELRHKSIDEKKEMRELIIDGIKEIISKPKSIRKVAIPKGESTIVFQLRFWNPAHPKYIERLNQYKSKKAHFNYYDGIIRLQELRLQDHFHSASEMLKKIEEWYKKYVDLKIKK